MKIKEITSYLETVAPASYQESYDNAGLIVGNSNTEVTGIILCLDSTEAIVEEAIAKNCNLIIAHHPIVFKGLKRFNGRNYVERTIIKAIKNDVAIYAIHTNLDNVYRQGVNAKIAEMLGLQNTRILAPKQGLLKMQTYLPIEKSEEIRSKLFEAGAGKIGEIDHQSFASLGVGTKGESNGGQIKTEVIFDSIYKNSVIQALEDNLPADQVVYDLVKVENMNPHVGSGMVGELSKAMPPLAFLKKLKTIMKVGCVKYTALPDTPIKKVAVCGGSGGFLLKKAIAAKADIFITADYKYHEFFDADGRIVIADIGHYESEQFTIELLHEILSKKFSTFAPAFAEDRVFLTEVNTNPVNYL